MITLLPVRSRSRDCRGETCRSRRRVDFVARQDRKAATDACRAKRSGPLTIFRKTIRTSNANPPAFTRVMHTPSPPIEVRQHQNFVEVNYEFMDVHRHVPLNARDSRSRMRRMPLKNYPHLGRSVAQYEGETLVVETAGVTAGVMDTLGVPGTVSIGSDAHCRAIHSRTETKCRSSSRMRIRCIFVQPFTVTFNYLRLPGGKIETWDCKPEEATFERFLPDKK